MTKIVIVEDEVTILEMYKLKFETEGYAVYTAENGKVGLEVIQKTNPDIILLDIMLPELNGIDMLKQLRQKPWGKGIKVVILTNLGDDDIEASLAPWGIDRYIVKAQYTPREVVNAVKEVLLK